MLAHRQRSLFVEFEKGYAVKFVILTVLYLDRALVLSEDMDAIRDGCVKFFKGSLNH